MDIRKTLELLTGAAGVSGAENEASRTALELLSEYAPDAQCDAFGNVTALIPAQDASAPTLMLDAHIDQIGFIVSYIDPDGFLKVGACGGPDMRIMLAQSVTVHGVQDIRGVVSTLPPHVSSDHTKVPEAGDIAIDIGMTREEAEKAKKELSTATQTELNLPFITTGPEGALHLQATLTRAKFEELCADLIEQTSLPVRNALSDAHLTASDLDQVLLVGGSTRIPAVQAKVMRMTGLEPSKSLNPDECVALGAAVQAGRLGGEALTGAGEDLLLMDVTPLTLSIETLGGVATHLIERNATIPTRFSKVFTTAAPFQSTVEIKVLQGEREFAKDNKLLGTFTLRGIKRAWAGVPKIEVTFDLDANGIVKVSARDMDTGKEQGITITGSSNLSEDEIQKAMRNAAAFAGQDQERKAALEAFNAAEAALYRVNTALGSKAGKALDRDTRSKIKDAVRALEKELRHKKADKLTTADVQSLNAAREALSAIATPLVTQWESEK